MQETNGGTTENYSTRNQSKEVYTVRIDNPTCFLIEKNNIADCQRRQCCISTDNVGPV